MAAVITAVYRPRQDDVLLLSGEGDALCAIPRADAAAAATAILAAADVPARAAELAMPGA